MDDLEFGDDQDMDGVSMLKRYFSGKKGIRRSSAFLNFVELLTESDIGGNMYGPMHPSFPMYGGSRNGYNGIPMGMPFGISIMPNMGVEGVK